MDYTKAYEDGHALVSDIADHMIRPYAVDQYVEIKRLRGQVAEARDDARKLRLRWNTAMAAVERVHGMRFGAMCAGVAAAFALGIVIGMGVA